MLFDLIFLLSLHKIRDRHSDTQFVKEELELGHSARLPLFQIIDPVLSEAVLLRHVAVFGVIFPPEHLLLLFQISVLASQTEQVKVKNGILLSQIDHLVLNGLVIVCAEGL